MILLVIGGSGSGKSEYAEKRIMDLKKNSKGELLYIATMKALGAESLERIIRHRNLRMGKGFRTIEKSEDILSIKEDYSLSKEKHLGLIECVSNLVANEMFKNEKIMDLDLVASKVAFEIEKLGESLKDMVIVTNNIFEDGICYDNETKNYMKSLALVNKRLFELADEVIEVVVGIPVTLKKEDK